MNSTQVISYLRLNENSDIAIFSTSPGINAERFFLPENDLEVGQLATLVGYGGQIVPIYAEIQITERIEKLEGKNRIFTNMYKTKSVSGHRACPGDSGGPVFIGKTIYGIHTGGDFNVFCSDMVSSVGYVSAIYPELNLLQEHLNFLLAENGEKSYDASSQLSLGSS